MKKLIPISLLLLASPVALALWTGKKGFALNNAGNDKIPKSRESLFIGS